MASEAVDVAAQPRWCLNVYRINRHIKQKSFMYLPIDITSVNVLLFSFKILEFLCVGFIL
ncbi:hypothetical protein DOL97_11570 [Salmonella enterica subsp. enterica serovar Derby]|nr:hypothetical protein DOL97_11570 [Salmonella enterica subsp. enterica serovar Derby]